MKKHLIAVFIAVVTCLAALSGCSLVRGFEKDLQVVFEVDGKYYDSGTVNIFNNAVVEEPAAPKGYYFRGWTNVPEWTAEESVTVPVLENTGLVRYNDIKDMVQAGRESVTLYGVFSEIVRHDLKVAWYDKETTSGLNQAAMDGFKTKLYAYLTEEGKNPESLDIIIQGYDGDVGTSCSAIMKHGDVDIMVGWAGTSNLTGTGGMPAEDILENVGKVKIGSKDRYAARLSDTELTKLVYIWIQNEYGAGYVPPVVEPDPEPQPPVEPTPDPVYTFNEFTETRLVLGWWNSSSSGLSETIVIGVVEGLKAALTASGKDVSALTIDIKSYSGKVAAAGGEILTDTDPADILLGFGGNLIDTDGGNLTSIKAENRLSGVKMGEKTGRYIDVYDDTNDFAKAVFEWFKSEESARALFAPAA